MTRVIELRSLDQLNRLINSHNNSIIVIDFHAKWCGPCHAIAPVYESLSKEFKSLTFTRCDVDESKDIAQHYIITAMPTFLFLKGGVKVDQIRGADRSSLEKAVRKYSSMSVRPSETHQWSSSGQTLGSSSSSEQSSSRTNPAAPANHQQPPSLGTLRDRFNALNPQLRFGIALFTIYIFLLIYK
ncbi:thioredoxin-like protein [Phakopsora pachyrhizi]|uniref:Thioredoxin-like protein n=1 Tax=Phakopsora pachyrhizi TaxID=170000 RepID=A0AAV0AR21_PHAPC|nr:thioredoxin-like protein [Phakopsora pachyrhizi]CAH7670773.1 thioredoxin-like protein [Phakopsora pachyrhizi]